MMNSLQRRAVPVRNKRARLRPSHEIVDLGFKMMAEAEARLDGSGKRRALQYRNGLILALLAYRPMRMRNFAALRIGHHLARAETAWWLDVPETEMKNGQRYPAAVPDALVQLLERYLNHYRGLLLGSTTAAEGALDALWLSMRGTKLGKWGLAHQICKHTKSAFGASITPHWFRDAAATFIAVADPRNIGDAHHVLGNALAMTERHYNQARSLEASRRHNAMIAKWRDRSKRPSEPMVSSEREELGKD
jgi:hypothetical protein